MSMVAERKPMAESHVAGIACTGRYGEALAWCVICIRARKNASKENLTMRQRAHNDMLHIGWTPEELDKLEQHTVDNGLYGLETQYT